MVESTKYKLTIGDSVLTVNLASIRVEDASGKDLGISPQGFTLLSCFVRAPKMMHTHDDLRTLLWGKDSETGNINNAISALRLFLQSALNTKEKLFINKPGVGYRLEAQVENIGSQVVNNSEDDERQIQEWRRRWEYLQDKPFTRLSVFLHLKRPMGRSKCVELLEGTKVAIGDDGHLNMLTTFEKAPIPNSIRGHRTNGDDQPVVSFWEPYDDENSVCRRGQGVVPPELVTGIEIDLPWSIFGAEETITLCELYAVQRFGVAIDDGFMRIGVDECAVIFEGEEFSFRYSMLDDGALSGLRELLKEVRKAPTSMPAMPLYWTISGARLLDLYYKSHLPEDKTENSNKRELGVFRGLSGPEKDISFYPEMPLSFRHSEEHDEYAFTVEMPRHIDWGAEVKEFGKLLEQEPLNGEHRYRLANALRMTGESGEALDLLKKGIDRREFHLHSFLLKAAILGKDMGLLEDALDAMQHVANQNDHETSMLGQVKCAEILIDMGRYDTALSEYIEPLIQQKSLSPDVFECQGRLLLRVERVPEAKKAFERALEIDSEHVSSLVFLGLLAADEETSTAMSFFEKAINADPESIMANKAIGRFMYGTLKDEESALVHLEFAVEKDPNDEEMWKLITACANTVGDLDKAERAGRNAVQINRTSENCLNLGIVLVNMKEREEALKWFQRALDEDPSNTVAVAYKEALESGKLNDNFEK